jgi:hypothetical protein
MVSKASLEDLYYLTIIFGAMKNLFKIKLLNPFEDEFNFIYEIFPQIPQKEVHYNKLILQDKFIEILNLKTNQKFLEENNNDFQFILTNEPSNFDESKSIVNNNVFKKIINENSAESSVPSKYVMQPEKISYQKEAFLGKINKNLFKTGFKKEVNTNLKNYFNFFEGKIFLKDVKLSISYFNEKVSDFQKTNFDEKGDYKTSFEETINKVLSIKDFTGKIWIINNIKFDENFNQAFKGQVHTIENNKICELIPFALVSYHFKEIDKKNNLRRRKKKKKILFKKEIKYLDEDF